MPSARAVNWYANTDLRSAGSTQPSTRTWVAGAIAVTAPPKKAIAAMNCTGLVAAPRPMLETPAASVRRVANGPAGYRSASRPAMGAASTAPMQNAVPARTPAVGPQCRALTT
jgi:hypothetical protein